MRVTIQRASLTRIDIDFATIHGTALTVFPGSSLAPRIHFPRWVLFLIIIAFTLGVIISSSGQILLFLAKVFGIASLTFLALLALIWVLHFCVNHLQTWWIQHRPASNSSYASWPGSFRSSRADKHRFLV